MDRKEEMERRQKALDLIQSEGLPDIIEKCRNGSDAEKEQAAEKLSFIATHDAQCCGMIITTGGVGPLVEMMKADSGRGDDDPRFDMKVRGTTGSTATPILSADARPGMMSVRAGGATAGSGDQVHIESLQGWFGQSKDNCIPRSHPASAELARGE
jgi:hypothetical protein